MNTEVNALSDKLLADMPVNNDIKKIKDAFMANTNKKYEELIADGMDKDYAIEQIAKDADEVTRVIKGLTKEKSIVKDAYRESAGVILRSSPFEIIKKSKRRTRELHLAFSLFLWASAAILYIITNQLLGYTEIALNPAEMSWTWLIFIIASLIECSAEIYFCRKELDVLNENIDLRQIDPARGDDLDLRGYQKKLTRKIRIMSSAVLWIPLILIFFTGGYMFNIWGVAWIVFLFGLFAELLVNFIKKLRKA